jgi:hypothetical protein
MAQMVETIFGATGTASRRSSKGPQCVKRAVGSRELQILRVDRQWQRKRGSRSSRALRIGCAGLPLEHVNEIAVGHHEGARGVHARCNVWRVLAHPPCSATILPSLNDDLPTLLRCAVDQRRVVRQRAAIPMQRGIDIGASPRIVQPTRAVGLQGERQTIGMTVATGRLAAIKCRIHLPLLTTQYRESLPELEHACRLPDIGRNRLLGAEQQRTPGAGCARELHGRFVAFGVGRRARARRTHARDAVVVEAREQPCQTPVCTMRITKLTPFRKAPLPRRYGVLRVAATRERVVGQQSSERCNEALVPAGIECGVQRRAARAQQLHCIPEAAMGELMIVLAFVPGAVVLEPRSKVHQQAIGIGETR